MSMPTPNCFLLIDDQQHEYDFYKAQCLISDIPLEQLLWAESGAAGVKIWESQRTEINLIILDHNFPPLADGTVYNGDKILKELRGLGCDVPIYITTGYNLQELKKSGLYDPNAIQGFVKKGDGNGTEWFQSVIVPQLLKPPGDEG